MHREVVVVVVVAVVATFASEEARACGPEFPHRLLADRRATLGELVEGSFDFEAAHLVKPADAFRVMEGDEPKGVREAGGARERALYEEGALLWNNGESLRTTNLDVDETVPWKKLLALPAAERKTRSTWAAFMLGRSTGKAKWFELTRKLAREGYDDALGLAAASFGEEARLALDAGDDVKAVRLYAEQAALGSASGRSSLLFVARDLLRDDRRLARAMPDPVAQQLIAAYLFTRSSELDDGRVAAVLRAVDKAKVTKMQAADRLAAAAYRAGNYRLARRFLDKSDATPLSSWIHAKLALRDGRGDEARAYLAKASAAFPVEERWSEVWHDGGDIEDVSPRARVDGERAVLALERRNYEEALGLFLSGGDGYWLDAAYVAERVLTSAELTAYVERHAPHAVVDVKNEWGGQERAPLEKLRTLLARRLVREHRFDMAVKYFDDDATRAFAAAYVDAYARGFIKDNDPDRAQERFVAATLLRRHGLEISGTELDPDWAAYDGDFDLSGWEREGDDEDGWKPRDDVMVPGPAYASYDEQLRAASSHAQPLVRFHYRSAAAELANGAADDLPRRSQAFAAVLCTASSWLIDREPERAATYYDRYVAEGASVEFAGSFGRTCPAPDFAAAAHDELATSTRAQLAAEAGARSAVRHRKRDVVLDTGALLGLAIVADACARLLARRRGRSAAATL